MAIGAKTRLDLRSTYGRHAIRHELVSIREMLNAPPKLSLWDRFVNWWMAR